MKRNKTIHFKADFYTTLCGHALYRENGTKTNCRATGDWRFVTCENCLNKLNVTRAENDGEE